MRSSAADVGRVPRALLSGYGTAEVDVGKRHAEAVRDGRRPTLYLNSVTLFVMLFLPWVLSTATCWALGFYPRYARSSSVVVVVLVGTAAVFMLWGLVFKAQQQDSGVGSYRRWYQVFYWTAFGAWLLGLVGGEYIFVSFMRTYYDFSSLNAYASVDVAHSHGRQFLDAGMMTFVPGTRLDRNLSSHFSRTETGDVYCVAPIVPGMPQATGEPSGNSDAGLVAPAAVALDFWAVGTNCCGTGPDGVGDLFQCGDGMNPLARAGLRWLHHEQDEHFLKAIRKAEANHGIRSDQPLFLRWMEDPVSVVSKYEDNGFQVFAVISLFCLSIQIFVVVLAVVEQTFSAQSKGLS